MDPVSRRFMWDVIEDTARERSVVLTTHSLDECEALCNKVVVMVGGKLKCLGNVQHLKSRFGMGYTVELKSDIALQGATEAFIKRQLHGVVTECHEGWFKAKIPQDKVTLAKIFRSIETHREALKLRDYSVCQTSLEQIFLHFAQGQKEETAVAPGIRVEGEEEAEAAGNGGSNDGRFCTQEPAVNSNASREEYDLEVKSRGGENQVAASNVEAKDDGNESRESSTAANTFATGSGSGSSNITGCDSAPRSDIITSVVLV